MAAVVSARSTSPLPLLAQRNDRCPSPPATCVITPRSAETPVQHLSSVPAKGKDRSETAPATTPDHRDSVLISYAWNGAVVTTPSTFSSPSARRARSMASSRIWMSSWVRPQLLPGGDAQLLLDQAFL